MKHFSAPPSELFDNCTVQINLARVAIGAADSCVGPRKISDYEFVWIHNHPCLLNYNGKDYELQAGDLVLIQPKIRHTFHWGEHNVAHLALHIDITSLSQSNDALSSDNWPLIRRLEEDDALADILRHIVMLYNADTQNSIYAKLTQTSLKQLLLWFTSAELSQLTEEPYRLPSALIKLFQHIDQEWSTGALRVWTIEELAALANISRAQLQRHFKEHLHESPVRCLKILRLEWAASILQTRGGQIANISEYCGWDDPFSFSKSFKARFGIGPSDMRSGATPKRTPLLTHSFQMKETHGHAASAMVQSLIQTQKTKKV